MFLNVLEQLYTDKCTVYEQVSAVDPETHRTRKFEKAVCKDVPCRISFSSISATDGENAKLVQSAKLFIGVETAIRPGSRVQVTRGDKVTDWTRSGLPAVYTDLLPHQEIMLVPFEGYA